MAMAMMQLRVMMGVARYSQRFSIVRKCCCVYILGQKEMDGRALAHFCSPKAQFVKSTSNRFKNRGLPQSLSKRQKVGEIWHKHAIASDFITHNLSGPNVSSNEDSPPILGRKSVSIWVSKAPILASVSRWRTDSCWAWQIHDADVGFQIQTLF